MHKKILLASKKLLSVRLSELPHLDVTSTDASPIPDFSTPALGRLCRMGDTQKQSWERRATHLASGAGAACALPPGPAPSGCSARAAQSGSAPPAPWRVQLAGTAAKDETSAAKRRGTEGFYQQQSNLRQSNHRTYSNTQNFQDSAAQLAASCAWCVSDCRTCWPWCAAPIAQGSDLAQLWVQHFQGHWVSQELLGVTLMETHLLLCILGRSCSPIPPSPSRSTHREGISWCWGSRTSKGWLLPRDSKEQPNWLAAHWWQQLTRHLLASVAYKIFTWIKQLQSVEAPRKWSNISVIP